MASDLIINGTTYSGTPASPANPYRPMAIEVSVEKIGKVIVAANGNRTWVHQSIKRTWTISWEKASETTRAALRALHLLTTTFTFTDQFGTSYTVQTEADDLKENTAHSDRANAYFYDLTLIVRQA